MKYIRKFLKLNYKERKLCIQTLFLSAIYRFRLKYCRFAKWEHKIGKRGFPTEGTGVDAVSRREILTVSQIVGAICKYTPWESACLVQALTAKRILEKKGIQSTLYLGVARNEHHQMVAHAWLRCGDIYVTGGERISEYTVTGIYGQKVSL